MAYGRFGGGSQSNLRSVDAGQARANKKDQERNVRIPKVVLPVKKKKKPVTLMGMTVKAPKSDVQKKIDSGQATVLAGRKLDSGKTLLTTEKATGKIVSKKDQDRKILVGSSPTMQGRPANVTKKFDNAGANFSDFPVDSKPATPIFNKASYMVKGGKQEYKGAPQLLEADKKLLSKNTKAGKGITEPTLPQKDSYTGPIFNKASYMVKGGKQEYKGQPTLLRGGDKGTKSGGTFASLDARQLLANAVREGKGQYQGVLPTATTNFMGQKRRVAKVGSNFFRIKSNRRLAKDPMSGIQLKYFKNQLAKGTNELKWSLVK